MKRNELYLEVPLIGEILLEPFTYSNGREGYVCIVQELDDKKVTFNLTVNPNDVPINLMVLKLYDMAQTVSEHLIDKTDMFELGKKIPIGRKFAQVVSLNTDYYED